MRLFFYLCFPKPEAASWLLYAWLLILKEESGGFVNKILVVFKGNQGWSFLNIHPADLADLLLLLLDPVVPGIAQEIDHLFFYIGLGGIRYAFPKPILQVHAEAGFLLDFPQRGLHLIFPPLHMAFGEGPMAAVPVLEQQQLGPVIVQEPIDQGSA